MRWCKECVVPEIAVDVTFNEDGVCSACIVKKDYKSIKWKEEFNQLEIITNKYRSKDCSYDCIVGGSGGKDSVFQSHTLKYKYNMNPLSCTWSPHMYTDIGWKNFQCKRI